MEGAKSSVVKSKSSNSAISKSASSGQKSHHGRQKSRSNADFPRVGGMKRRKGMYVEKRSTKVSLNNTADSPKKSKTSTSPPRRGKNKFLNSVLTILDQDTQGTQTGTSREVTRQSSSRTKKKRKFKVEDTDLTVESIDQDINKSRLSLKIRDDLEKPEKKSYRSKILKEELFHTDTERLSYRSKVLKEELFHTDTERLFIMAPKKVSPDHSDDALDFMKKSSIYEEVAEGMLGMADEKGVAAKLLRGLHSKQFKDEPSTVMGEIKQKTFDNLKQKISGKLAKCNAERGIYNFFVDLLETSFDVYNVADNSPDEEETTNDLYIDENVAQKLKVEKCATIEERCSNNSIEKEKNEGYSVRDDDGIGWNDAETFQASIFQNMRPKSPLNTNRSLKSPAMSRYSSKLKSSSFDYTKPQRRESPQTQSLIMPKRTSSKKKNRKETLLNILKEELSKQVEPIEEPQNMYQALKLIAKNKKKERREITFADTPTEISVSGYENHHCRFKGRKVICSSTQSKKNNKKTLPSKNVTRTIPTMITSPEDSETDYPERDSKYTPGTTDVDMGMESYDTDSYHTLEVREYQTDLLPFQQAQRKEIYFAKKSEAFFKKDRNTNLEVFEERFVRHNSEESIDDTKLLCKKNCISESDLDSEIDDPSAISFDLPINIE